MHIKWMTSIDWLVKKWPVLESQIPPRILSQAEMVEKANIKDAQMAMFHKLNDFPYGMEYLDKRNAAEEFADQYINQTFKSE